MRGLCDGHARRLRLLVSVRPRSSCQDVGRMLWNRRHLGLSCGRARFGTHLRRLGGVGSPSVAGRVAGAWRPASGSAICFASAAWRALRGLLLHRRSSRGVGASGAGGRCTCHGGTGSCGLRLRLLCAIGVVRRARTSSGSKHTGQRYSINSTDGALTIT